jgi:DNA-binding transcriptional regulator YdaS (Cro superfamily)
MEIQTAPPLDRAIEIAGGMTKMAKALGLSGHAVVYQWRQTRVPAEKCPDVEALTGVRCEELRPDVNWAVLRATGAPSLEAKAA